MEALEDRRLLAVVTDAGDSGPGTLRDALASGDADITFDTAAMGGTTVTLSTGDLMVTGSVAIDGDDGAGGKVTVDAAQSGRVFNIDNGNDATYENVSISNLIITGGLSNDGGGIIGFEHLTLTNVCVQDNSVTGNGDGGGMSHGNETRVAGNLVITDSLFTRNRADDDSSALDHYNAQNLTITGTTFTENVNGDAGSAAALGGMVGTIRVIDLIDNTPTHTILENSSISGNTMVGTANNNYIYPLGFFLLTNNTPADFTLEMRNSDVSGNTELTTNPGAGYLTVAYGLGLYLSDMTSTVLDNVTLDGNDSPNNYLGGGLVVTNSYYTSTHTFTNLTISNNGATYGPGLGGGAFINDFTIDINQLEVEFVDSTFSGNSGGLGGAVYSYSADVTLTQSTVSGNNGTNGGGIYHNRDAYVGPPGGDPAEGLTLYRSTVTDNSAALGGGVFLGAEYSINYQFSSLQSSSSIISGNSSSSAGDDVYDTDVVSTYNPAGNISSVFSLVGSNGSTGLAAASPDAAGNLIGAPGSEINAMLAPLANNGGDTETHSPLAGSPAIDAGDPAAGGALDQRGGPRIVNTVIDMGSVEFDGSVALPGDFNDDGVYNCDDLNMLSTEIAAGTNNLAFNLNADNVVDVLDRDVWLMLGGAANLDTGNAYLVADGNLDGSVDVSDFSIWNAAKFTSNANYCEGDYNVDGFVDVSDFALWNAAKFTSSGMPVGARASNFQLDVGAGFDRDGSRFMERVRQYGSMARWGEVPARDLAADTAELVAPVLATSEIPGAVENAVSFEEAAVSVGFDVSPAFEVEDTADDRLGTSSANQAIDLIFADLDKIM